MKILRAFAVDGNMYYIVWVKATNISSKGKTPLYGVFRHDDTKGEIPLVVRQKADILIQKEGLLEGLE